MNFSFAGIGQEHIKFQTSETATMWKSTILKMGKTSAREWSRLVSGWRQLHKRSASISNLDKQLRNYPPLSSTPPPSPLSPLPFPSLRSPDSQALAFWVGRATIGSKNLMSESDYVKITINRNFIMLGHSFSEHD